MGVHGDDIVSTIREALKDERFSAQAPTQSEVRMTPNPAHEGWQNRDGRLEFDVMGRDWFRAFRITVEVVEEFQGDMGSDEWVLAGG